MLIKQKMVGTGTIHDIESCDHDREVIFPDDFKFAVVKAAHYRDDEHAFFVSLIDAIEFAVDSDFSCKIVGYDGAVYSASGIFSHKFKNEKMARTENKNA